MYDHGRRVRRASFVVFGLPNETGCCRLGLTVTRRVGCAVLRNRVKRRLRDVFRRHREQLPGSLDLVINARAAVAELPQALLERELLGAVADLAKVARRPRAPRG